VKNFVEFFNHESCGKCTLCREGNGRLLELLERITEGKAVMADLDLMEDLATTMLKGAFCGLGQAAPVPVLGCLKYFRDDFVRAIERTNRAAA
jgi:NADH-quinone oxidoreductase subunit F